MSVTDELRAELTKRGIEWRWEDERTTYWYVTVDGEEWGEWTAIEMGGYLHLSFSSGDVLTPAQAIAATLGESMTDTEKAALERRIDELCAEVEYNRQTSRSRLERIDQLKDENAKLCARIDELCAEVEKYRSARDASADLATKTIDRIRELEAEVERLHADQAHWELGNCPSCPNIVSLQEALEQNGKLRELCAEQLDNLMLEICSKAWWCEGKDWHTCNDDACGNYTFVILARELGIEVD